MQIRVPELVAAITANGIRAAGITPSMSASETSIPMATVADAARGAIPAASDIRFEFIEGEVTITLRPAAIMWAREYVCQQEWGDCETCHVFRRVPDPEEVGVTATVPAKEFWEGVMMGVQALYPGISQIKRQSCMLHRFTDTWEGNRAHSN